MTSKKRKNPYRSGYLECPTGYIAHGNYNCVSLNSIPKGYDLGPLSPGPTDQIYAIYPESGFGGLFQYDTSGNDCTGLGIKNPLGYLGCVTPPTANADGRGWQVQVNNFAGIVNGAPGQHGTVGYYLTDKNGWYPKGLYITNEGDGGYGSAYLNDWGAMGIKWSIGEHFVDYQTILDDVGFYCSKNSCWNLVGDSAVGPFVASIPLRDTAELRPKALKMCNPNPAQKEPGIPMCPGISPFVPPCFAPVDATSVGLSAAISFGFSSLMYRQSGYESIGIPAVFSSVSDNLIRFFSSDITGVEGNADWATYSTPLLSGVLSSFLASNIGNQTDNLKNFLLGSATNYLTNASYMYLNPSYCAIPLVPTNKS